jgi:beta-lactam-binding protein with PASTA domain
VTLTAQPAAGSTFGGWSGGGCSGTGTCTVTTNADTTVTATFSLIPTKCVVPKVKGKTLSAAKRAIKAHHCSAGRVTRAASRTVKKGHVISQKPKPGSRLKHGAKVNLVVSKGRR